MILTITKCTKKVSKFGGYFYLTEFLGIDNKTYYTCIDPRKKNYLRWKEVLKVGVSLKGLKIKTGKLIDADSRFEKIGG